MIKYNFCPKCSGKVKQYADHQKCSVCGYKIYITSRPTASVLIVKDGKVLLGTKSRGPRKGKIDVPGGFLDEGESPKKGALREIKEETGLDIELLDLLGIYINDNYEYQNEIVTALDFFYVGKKKDMGVSKVRDLLELVDLLETLE